MSSGKFNGIGSLGGPLLALLCSLGCGLPGAPQPPSLELPKTVGDLRAARKGSRVVLNWTPPRQTTDRKNIHTLGPTRICRVTGTSPMTACMAVAEIAGGAPPARNDATQAEFADTLPPDLMASAPTGFVTYAVEVLNTHGRSAGLSNQVQAPTAPTLPPPDHVVTRLQADGVVVGFRIPEASSSAALGNMQHGPLRYEFRIYRKLAEAGAKPSPPVSIPVADARAVPDLPQPNFVVTDRAIEWEKHYTYTVAAVTSVYNTAGEKTAEVEGDPSPPAEIFAHDTFPPAVPQNLQAVYAAANDRRFIDLTWTPDTDADLAGYNVYRREEGGSPRRISGELAKAPSFRDANVAPGHRYLYSVSAVDVRGNESARSVEAGESAPRP